MTKKIHFLTFIIIYLFTFSSFVLSQEIEIPLCDSADVIDHVWYKIKYNESTEQSDWAAYELTRDELRGSIPRRDNFRVDPAIETGSAELDDYRGSGYDRGHLVPAGDLKITAEAMSASFLLSNISPQVSGFNRGIWLELENYVRTWAWEYSSIYIVTGPIFNSNNYKTIGENSVAVPDYFYKAVLDNFGEEKKAIGFIIPNRQVDDSILNFMVSIDHIETITGEDLFYHLSDDLEEKLESQSDADFWLWEEFNFSENKNIINVEAVDYKYWINSSSGTRHNSSCEYYGNTRSGYYTNTKKGKACGRCGG